MLLLSCVWITKSADDLATTMSNSTINPELFPFDDDVHCALCTVCSDGDDIDTEDEFHVSVEEN